jgi:hypothetical protein
VQSDTSPLRYGIPCRAEGKPVSAAMLASIPLRRPLALRRLALLQGVPIAPQWIGFFDDDPPNTAKL